MKIYLFRHAQTFYNKKHMFTGWKDSKLTPQGFKDARKIALKLKGKKIDVAFRSRLTRTKQTLDTVLKYHPKCKVIVDDRMIERSYGELAGRTHKWYARTAALEDYKTLRHWHKIDHLEGEEKEKFIEAVGATELQIVRRSHSHVPPNGESVAMVEKRVKSFIKYLLKMMRKEKVNVAICAHGNSNRAFRRFMENLSIKEEMRLENPWDDYFEYSVK